MCSFCTATTHPTLGVGLTGDLMCSRKTGSSLLVTMLPTSDKCRTMAFFNGFGLAAIAQRGRNARQWKRHKRVPAPNEGVETQVKRFKTIN